MEPLRPKDPLLPDSMPNEDSRTADPEGSTDEIVSAEPQTGENATEESRASAESAESRETGAAGVAAEPRAQEDPAAVGATDSEPATASAAAGEDQTSGEEAPLGSAAAASTPPETSRILPEPESVLADELSDDAASAASAFGASDQTEAMGPSSAADSDPQASEASADSAASSAPAADGESSAEASVGAGSADAAETNAEDETAMFLNSAEALEHDAAAVLDDAAPEPPAAPTAESAGAEPSPADATATTAAEPSAPEPPAALSAESAGAEPSLAEATASAEAPFSRPWLAHYPDEVPHTLKYPDVNIAQFLLDAVGRYPDHKALHFLGKTMTYREVHTAAVRLASELVALGVSKGDRVAIMLPNCPQAVVSYYGVLLAGAVVVQTNPLYVERELEHQLRDSGAVAIITVDLLYARLSRVRGERPEEGPIPQLRHVIITSIKDGLPFPKNMLYPIKQRKEGFKNDIPYGKHGVLSYRKLLAGRAPSVELPELAHGDELAALQYTGGTTGTPKGVMLTHANFVSNTLQTSAWCYKAEDGKEKFLAALPLFHVFGLTVLMNMSVLRAGMLILLPRFEIDTVLKTIDAEKPTIFPGAPTMYVALINHENAAKNDLSSVNVCISGSAALPLEVQERFEALTGGRLVEGYGLTEASPVTHANPIWGKRKIGTIGLPFPDTDAAIIDPASGRRLKVGEMGQLVIRGPQVMKGYWNRPDDTAATLRDGWLHTGDLATMDEEGYFTIMDRIKDVIIASGFNVYPREVEEVLFEHPAVREAAVVGVHDEYRGETVKAFIVLKEGWHVSRSQLDRWCRDRLASYKVPHQYAFRETLPKTMVGKVLRRKLAEEEAEAQQRAKEE